MECEVACSQTRRASLPGRSHFNEPRPGITSVESPGSVHAAVQVGMRQSLAYMSRSGRSL